MPSNAIANPANESLILRGLKVEVDSDVGHQFAIDCTRFVEGLVTEAQLRKKYALDDSGWQALADHEELQRAVGAQKERRIRSGEAAREKAAALFVEAPAVLGDIIKDNTASPRHRVDAIRSSAPVPVEQRKQRRQTRNALSSGSISAARRSTAR